MMQLAYSDMDYPKTLEHGMFTIGIVCLLILINLIRFVYGIYLLIKQAAKRNELAKVQNIEVQLEKLSQSQNEQSEENLSESGHSNQLEESQKELLHQIKEESYNSISGLSQELNRPRSPEEKIKQKACKKHLFHQNSCAACVESDRQNIRKSFQIKKERREAIARKQKEKEDRIQQLLARFPSSTESIAESQVEEQEDQQPQKEMTLENERSIVKQSEEGGEERTCSVVMSNLSQEELKASKSEEVGDGEASEEVVQAEVEFESKEDLQVPLTMSKSSDRIEQQIEDDVVKVEGLEEGQVIVGMPLELGHCRVSSIDLSNLQILSKREERLHSLDAQDQDLNQDLIEYQEDLPKGSRTSSNGSAAVSDCGNAIEVGQEALEQSFSELQAEPTFEQALMTMTDNQSLQPNDLQLNLASLPKDDNIDYQNIRACLYNTVESSHGEFAQNQYYQKAQSPANAYQLSDSSNAYATVQDRDPKKSPWLIPNSRNIRSSTTNQETVMSSVDRYDAIADPSRFQSLRASVMTGELDKNNPRASLMSCFSRRVVMSSIESGVIDMVIPSKNESETGNIEDTPSQLTKSTAAMPLPIFGILTNTADLTTQENYPPIEIRMTEESVTKLSEVEAGTAWISQESKGAENSTRVQSQQQPRIRRESGNTDAIITLEQSLVDETERNRASTAHPCERRTQSLDPSMQHAEAFMVPQSNVLDEAATIHGANSKQITKTRSRKRRYGKSRRQKSTVPKLIVSPYEEPILQSIGWSNYQVDLACKDTQARKYLRELNETGQLDSLMPPSVFSPSVSLRPVSVHREGRFRQIARSNLRKKNFQLMLQQNQEKLRMSVPMPMSRSQWRVAPIGLSEVSRKGSQVSSQRQLSEARK